MGSIKAKQDDLRRLMKERRENLKDQTNRVDSPFAKYNSSGQLFCIICNVQIKSNGLWAPHIAGKMHKENALKKKKSTSDIVKRKNIQTEDKSHEMMPPPAKILKVDTKEPLPKPEPDKTTGKISLLDAYSSSSSEDESSDPPTALSVPNTSTTSSVLPKDFFDATSSTSLTPNMDLSQTEKKEAAVNAVETLPEGFFDDPVLDAKARNIEYKDPVEEEWEKYQKAIAEETNVSKTIIAEDLEESTLERDIAQIDEQMHQWLRIQKIESLVEDVKSKVPSKLDDTVSSGSTDDELDDDDLLDWRSKGVKRR